MELKVYLNILRRRWPVVVIVPLVVVLLGAVQEAGRDPSYSATARVSIIRERDPLPDDRYAYDNYYNYLTSEFAIDDLVEATRGDVFAEAVANRLRAAGIEVGTGEVQGALAVDRKHRLISYRATSKDPTKATAIARAAAEELEARAFEYVGIASSGAGVVARITDRPDTAASDTGRARLLIAMEIVASLMFGVLLAFFVHYVDDTLYDAETTAQALGAPVLASVPVERRR